MEVNYSFSVKLRPNEIYIMGDPFILLNESYHQYINSIKNCAGVINKDFINIPMKTKKEYIYDSNKFLHLNYSGIIAVFAYYMLKDKYQRDLRNISGIGSIICPTESEKTLNVDNGRIKIYSDNTLLVSLDGSMLGNMNS